MRGFMRNDKNYLPITKPLFPAEPPDTDAFCVAIGDTQIGSMVALMTPKVELANGQPLLASKAQMWMWDCWRNFWDYAHAYKRKTKKRAIVVHLGDMIQGCGKRHPDFLEDLAAQMDMATDILKPVREFADKFYVCKGTEYHSGPGAENEKTLAKLGVKADRVEWAIRTDIGGKLFDCAHVGRAGTRPWTVGMANLVSQVLVDYVDKREKRFPDYVLRGHKHVQDDTGIKFSHTRGVIVPGWQLPDAYVFNKCGAATRSNLGGILIDGDWMQHILYQPEREGILYA